MKKSRFTEAQIVDILAQAARGEMTVRDVCAVHGISEQTLHRWKKRYVLIPRCADTSCLSPPHLSCTQHLSGRPAFGQAPAVRPVVVVEHEVALELAAKSHVFRDEIAGERRLPALLEDRSLHPFDEAVGLGTPRPDERVQRAQVLERPIEDVIAELRAVVRAHALEVPADVSQIAGHAVRKRRGESRVGVSRGSRAARPR